jgi:molybdopterin-guanine dinucleotide biosynthesis protein A
VARPQLTGVLLVGGASTRFGSPKALAEIDGETFADRGRRVLAEACDEVLVVGKTGELPFEVIDDASEVIRTLGEACRDAAVPQTGPLPGAWAKSALPVLERRLAEGPLALYRTYDELDVAELELDASLLADVDRPSDLV